MSRHQHQTVGDLCSAIEQIAPLRLAESWDNVGLLVGMGDWELGGPVMLTIDLTPAVAAEAIEMGASAVIAYHPVIFEPIRRLGGSSANQRVLMTLLGARTKNGHGHGNGHGIAVYSPHTALDAAEGGLTDWLADGIVGIDGKGIASKSSTSPGSHHGGDRRSILPSVGMGATQQVKIVTFAPADAVEKLRLALGSAGAGIIGNYELCSFTVGGHGSFHGNAATRPSVGRAEKFEQVPETRLEMVCSSKALPLALEMLRKFHPYEEPAVDVYALSAQPQRRVGVGRRLTLDHAQSLSEIAHRLAEYLKVAQVEVFPAMGAARDLKKISVSRVGVVPGAGGSVAKDVLADGCEVFVTGEMKHHEILAATGAGMNVILGGHTQTERGYLPILASRLSKLLPGVEFSVSRMDGPPGVVVGNSKLS